jgi:hypothetical protein
MRIAGEVAKAVSAWRSIATTQKITKHESDFMAGAFDHTDLKDAAALGAKAPRVLTLAKPPTKKPAGGRVASPGKPPAPPAAKRPVAKQGSGRKPAPAPRRKPR